MKFKILFSMFLILSFAICSFSQKSPTQKSLSVTKTTETKTVEIKKDVVFPQQPQQDALFEKVKSSDPIVRRQGVMDMAQTRDTKYVETIEKYLDDDNKLVKMAAIESLGTMRIEKSINKILDILSKTTDKDIKNSCIIAISYMPRLEKHQTLVNIALNEQDENLRVSAIRTLGSFGVKDIENDMIKLINDKKSSINLRVAAGNYLGAIKSEKSVDSFVKLLKDENNLLRIEAIKGLGDMQVKSATEQLRLISNESIPEIQLEAALSLAKMEDNFALNYIYKYLDSQNPSYRNMALNIIGMIGDNGSIKILDDKIKSTNDLSFKSFMEFTREKIKARIKLVK